MNNKSFKMQVKEIQEDGTFVGFASVYGNVDHGGDVVTKGAFKRTLDHKDSKVVLLWQHKQDSPIGIGKLEDSERGLVINGKLNLDVATAKEAYSLLKQGAIKGLSIGYNVVKDKWEKGIRYLKELKLHEVSLVTFPMNELAEISSVKEKDIEEEKASTFLAELQVSNFKQGKEMAIAYLMSSIDKILSDEKLSADQKINTLDLSLTEFHEFLLKLAKNMIKENENSDSNIDFRDLYDIEKSNGELQHIKSLANDIACFGGFAKSTQPKQENQLQLDSIISDMQNYKK